jgi:hypothetical protein
MKRRYSRNSVILNQTLSSINLPGKNISQGPNCDSRNSRHNGGRKSVTANRSVSEKSVGCGYGTVSRCWHPHRDFLRREARW